METVAPPIDADPTCPVSLADWLGEEVRNTDGGGLREQRGVVEVRDECAVRMRSGAYG